MESPFIVLTEKSYIVTTEENGKYSVVFNNKKYGNYDKFIVEPMYKEETSTAYWIGLEGNNVRLCEISLD